MVKIEEGVPGMLEMLCLDWALIQNYDQLMNTQHGPIYICYFHEGWVWVCEI